MTAIESLSPAVPISTSNPSFPMSDKSSYSAVRRDADKFVLRLPDGYRDKIYAEAKKNNRSMNSEMIKRLIDSFKEERRSWRPVPGMLIVMKKDAKAIYSIKKIRINDGVVLLDIEDVDQPTAVTEDVPAFSFKPLEIEA